MTLRNASFETSGGTGLASDWSWSGQDPGDGLGTTRGRLASDGTFTATDGDYYICLGSNSGSDDLDFVESTADEDIGDGTAADDDEFQDTLAQVDGGVFVVPTSVSVKNSATEKATDAASVISGTGVTGWINYFSGEIYVAEDSSDVWTTSDDVLVDYQTSPHSISQSITQRYVDLTGQNYLAFDNLRAVPSSVGAAVTWTLAVLIDDEIVQSWSYDSGDAGSGTSERTYIDVSSYTGLHDISFRCVFNAGSTALFDDGTRIAETFETWSGTHDEWIETAASYATFDAGSQTRETFEDF